MINKFLKDSAVYTIASFISRGISLLLLPFYVRFLTKEEYGLFDLILLSANFINLSFSLEITQAIGRFLPTFRLENAKIGLISTAFLAILLSYSLFLTIYVFFEEFIQQNLFQSEFNGKTYFLIGLYIVSNGLFLFFQNNLRWDLKSYQFALNSILFTLINVFGVFLFIYKLKLGIDGVLYSGIVASVFSIFSSYLCQKKYYTYFFSVKYAKKIIVFSFPLIFSSISVYFSLYMDRIIINKFLGLEELAVFGVGYRFATIVGLISIGFSSSIAPLIYNSPYALSTKSSVSKLFLYYLLFSSLLVLFLSIFSKEIILIFATKEYLIASTILPLITSSVVFSSLYLFFPGLSVENKTRNLAVINFLSAILNLVLCLILVDNFGVVGIAVSTLLTSIFSFAVNYYYSQKYYFVLIRKDIVFMISLIFLTCFISSLFLNQILIYSSLSVMYLTIKLFFFLIVCLLLYMLVYRNRLAKFKTLN